jgi:hypothetical protein
MKMKSLIILVAFVSLFSLVLTNSCKKDSSSTTPVTPVAQGIISLTDLQGNWNFVSMQYNGKTYLSCTDMHKDASLPSTTIGSLSLNISLTTANYGYPVDGVVVLTNCDGVHPQDTFTLNAGTNLMTWDNGTVFQIMSYDSNTKTLVVKTVSTTYLVNVTYTLQK